MGGVISVPGAFFRSGYIEEDLKELEARIALDVHAQLKSKAALVNLVTRILQDAYERSDVGALKRFYNRLSGIMKKLSLVIPSLKMDIEKKGWRKNPWINYELDFDSLYYVAAMDHIDYLKSHLPLELTYEDFNASFPWEVLERIRTLKKAVAWGRLYLILLEEYGSFVKARRFYAELVPAVEKDGGEAFCWTADLIIEVLSDMMEENLSSLIDRKERELQTRIGTLRARLAGLEEGELRSELERLLLDLEGGLDGDKGHFLNGDRCLELSFLEAEVDDLLTRQENQRLFTEGKKWELFQNTPRSYFI